MIQPRVISVNVGPVRTVEWRGREVRTAIWKLPVEGRGVSLKGVNLAGDDQADRSVHGGIDKAVYAYGMEDYRYWSAETGLETYPGLFGENLTVEGLDLGAVLAGEQWQVGTAVLEVTQPRLPCYKLGMRLNDAQFPKRFLAAGRLGTYLRIIRPGDVAAQDVINLLRSSTHPGSPARYPHRTR